MIKVEKRVVEMDGTIQERLRDFVDIIDVLIGTLRETGAKEETKEQMIELATKTIERAWKLVEFANGLSIKE